MYIYLNDKKKNNKHKTPTKMTFKNKKSNSISSSVHKTQCKQNETIVHTTHQSAHFDPSSGIQ